jgi:hypothetical protein
MTMLLMSNPGLHLALLGNPRKKKKVRRGKSSRRHTRSRSPKRRGRARGTHPARKNPMKAVSAYVGALKRAPREILSTFKGPKKIKHALFAAGGAVGTYALGGIVTAKLLVPALNAVGAGTVMSHPIAKRVIGGLVPFTVGYVASRFVRSPDIKKAIQVGGAVASLMEIAMPGMIGGLIARATPMPVLAMAPAAATAAVKGPVSGMNGLGGYVDSPAYQGTGGYVDSPAYQGTGDNDEVDGYVDSPAYQGTGADDDLAASDDVMAGVDGYMEQGQKYLDSYLN